MSAIPARRRRRMVVALVTSVLTLLALPAGLVIGANGLLNDAGGDKVDEVPAIQIPSTVVRMLAVTSARADLAAVAVIALSPEGQGGTIVSLPVGAAADVGADEAPRRIADSWIAGGVAALRADVEDLLNITLDDAVVVGAPELSAVLAPMGEQPVTLAAPIWDGGGESEAVQVVPAGSSPLSPAEVAAGLAAVQVGVPESMRLPQVKALWGAVARAGVDSGPVASSTSTSVGSAATSPSGTLADIDLIRALLAGRVDVWQISSTRLLDAQRNPASLDLYALDGGEALMVMASVAPGALTLSGANLSVMLDVPFDDASLTREAVTRLAYLGANVVVVRRGLDPPAERTVVHVGDPIARTQAETFTSLLGPLEFVDTGEVISGVDARIVLGNDFKALLASGGVPTTSTTTTTVAG